MDAIVRLDSTNVSSNALVLPVPGVWAGLDKEVGDPTAMVSFAPCLKTLLQIYFKSMKRIIYRTSLSSFF